MDEATPLAVTVKVAVVAPAGMVKLAGTVAGLPVPPALNKPEAPPAGAGAVRVTVPVEVAQHTTVVGFNETLATTEAGGVSVKLPEMPRPA